MAFADWTVANSNTAIARDKGIAHTLAGVGDRLRRAEGVVPPNSPSSFSWGSLCRTNLLDPGDSGTIAVSQRVWVRYTQAFRGSSDLGDGLCIGAKCYYNGSSLQLHPGGEGYKCIFGMHDGTGNPAEIAFGLRLHRSGSSEAVAAVEAASFTPAQGTWYPIRFDCIPLSSTKDVLRVYSGTGAPGAEVWTQQIEVFPESGMGNGWASNSAFANQLHAYGLGWQQYGEIDTNAQMDFHHYRALVRTGGPFPDQE